MLDEIEAYIAVVECQSFSKAARKLGISTPIITRRVQGLEKKLNSQLLHRTTRELSQTEAGTLFYQEALEIIAHFKAGKHAVNSLKKQVVGHIKIGLPMSISQLWVMPAMKRLCDKYPSITIEIIQGNHLLSLIHDNFSVILHCGALPDSSFYFRKIRNWSKLTCASKKYLSQSCVPKNPSELINHNCLDHVNNLNHGWLYYNKNRPQSVIVKGNVSCSSNADLAILASTGLGIVYLPDFIVTPYIKRKKLEIILAEYQPPEMGVYAIYPSKKHLNKKTDVMLDFLQEVLID